MAEKNDATASAGSPQKWLRNTLRHQVVVKGSDGHNYFYGPRAVNALPVGVTVDGSLPEGIVEVTGPV